MAQWNFTIHNGIPLREAIEDENRIATIECLRECYKELYDKMSDEDRDYYQYDIEDAMEILNPEDLDLDDNEEINYHLQEFYDICDDVRAFVAI